MKNLVLLLTVLSLNFSAFAQDNFNCANPELANTATLSEGRAVPLFAHAKRFRVNLLDKSSCKHLTDTQLYCLVSTHNLESLSKEYGCAPDFKVDHVKIKALLGIAKDEKSATYEQIEAKVFALRTEAQNLKLNGEEKSGYFIALEEFLNKFMYFKALDSGKDWEIYGADDKWLRASGMGSEEETVKAALGSTSLLTPTDAKSLGYEILYEKSKPFYIAALICLIAFIMALTGPNSERLRKASMILALGALGVEVYAMVLRYLISGRAPVTNMFETVMWTGFGVLVLALIIAWKKKDARVLGLGIGANVICLFMMNFATKMLDGSIRPLTPVLRDNFWLSTHVTTITLSYSCFFLSWVISNYILGKYILAGVGKPEVKRWNDVNRISMQVGAVLLAAGIILGGVWADYSWGRFWGWDPKETWSLIALIIYMAVLHGKYAGWFKGVMFSVAGGVSFLFVLMAWFGVNYILAVGLHSYGFSNGGAAFLGGVFISQLLIIGMSLFKFYREKNQTVQTHKA